jgi:Mlc titration factor MtfA (ptsG expression regulator)
VFRLLQRLSRSPPPIDTSLWQQVRAATPWVAALDALRESTLQALSARFLHQKTITPVAGLTLDAAQCLQLAALCCMPLLEFGDSGMQRWSQVIVYPNAFRVHRSHTDAAGVLHEWEDELIGESWGSGPLILSWEDVQADLAEPREGFCVVVHEMAHKLDALDGEMDGTPPLPREWHRRWVHDFQRAYDLFCADVDAGREMLIDAYAAEAPEEFFAVVSEYHFSAPALLRKTMPEVAAHLRRFYGPPPFL